MFNSQQTGPDELAKRARSLTAERLRGMRRGIEKESLRALPTGALALTPHPASLGSALTHPSITTDFSESQVELITGAHGDVESCLAELNEIHRFVYQSLRAAGDEMLWVSSMPCGLPTDETIPIARYGNSNVGRAKSVYRTGLSFRYGKRMQTISGIHYNWSLPGVTSEEYFALIRNFRRHAFLLMLLFGASPAVCSTFVEGRNHDLLPFTGAGAVSMPFAGTLHKPFGTTLRMGRLGYQSDAQSSLAVSYNGLEGYAASLHDAMTRPYPAYEAIGIQNPGGEYNQLATTLLQIENEFYGTIRPKRVIRSGERPLHALRERGVEYVEVRLMDLDPFEPAGINAGTMRFLDVFLLHCLISDSAPDSPAEIAALGRNQQRTAASGREPGLTLERAGASVTLTDWGLAILAECAPIAAVLDAAVGGSAYAEAVARAVHAVQHPDTLPSARVLAAIAAEHEHSFVRFIRSCSQQTQAHFLAAPLTRDQDAAFQGMTAASIAEQKAIEAADTLSFEAYRQQYVDPARLVV